eukprot:351138-Chlamydomonas_euryale.AAC.11
MPLAAIAAAGQPPKMLEAALVPTPSRLCSGGSWSEPPKTSRSGGSWSETAPPSLERLHCHPAVASATLCSDGNSPVNASTSLTRPASVESRPKKV